MRKQICVSQEQSMRKQICISQEQPMRKQMSLSFLCFWLSSLLFFTRVTSEKKRHEDDSCALSSLCLKGARTRGEDDNDLCDRYCLLVFKGATTRRKKGHKIKQGTHL
jgi:hypothetical protein